MLWFPPEFVGNTKEARDKLLKYFNESLVDCSAILFRGNPPKGKTSRHQRSTFCCPRCRVSQAVSTNIAPHLLRLFLSCSSLLPNNHRKLNVGEERQQHVGHHTIKRNATFMSRSTMSGIQNCPNKTTTKLVVGLSGRTAIMSGIINTISAMSILHDQAGRQSLKIL